MRARGLAWPFAEHVARLVDSHVFQAKGPEEVRVGLPPLGFLEGRRRDFAQPDLIRDRVWLIVFRRLQRGTHGHLAQETRTAFRPLLRWQRRRADDTREDRDNRRPQG